MSMPLTSTRIERPWLSWGPPAFSIGVVAILLVLGIANIVIRAQWHEVEDGVRWAARAEGVTAVEVAPGSTGERAGVHAGDLLLAVNGVAVTAPADVFAYQHGSHEGGSLQYTLARLGSREVLQVSLTSAARAGTMY